MDLSGAKFSDAILFGAKLSDADLSHADLSGARLSDADLFHAGLSGANLFHAGLSGANLSGANLSAANLSAANLSAASIGDADFSGTDASSSLLIIVEGFENLKVDQYTKFDELLTDMPELIAYLKKNYKGVDAILVNDKQDLIDKLKRRGHSDDFIKMTVGKSRFKSE
jgi:hypothetical protein